MPTADSSRAYSTFIFSHNKAQSARKRHPSLAHGNGVLGCQTPPEQKRHCHSSVVCTLKHPLAYRINSAECCNISPDCPRFAYSTVLHSCCYFPEILSKSCHLHGVLQPSVPCLEKSRMNHHQHSLFKHVIRSPSSPVALAHVHPACKSSIHTSMSHPYRHRAKHTPLTSKLRSIVNP